MVNLLSFFRVSLFTRIVASHSSTGWANRAVELTVATLLEFKAFDLFALTFGVGVAIQAERAASRDVSVTLFLIRRFLVLLAFGILHITLISNVDILCLYAVCGLLLIPLLRLPVIALVLAGVAAIYLRSIVPGTDLPGGPALEQHAALATHMYAHGGFLEILAFRWNETLTFILPLLAGSAQKVFGLMLIGIALWRSRVLREPQRYRLILWVVCAVGLIVGLLNDPHRADVPMALAYLAALLAWPGSQHPPGWLAAVAATGRMALTNYLTQSIVFAILFYGYGFGLFGRLEPAPAALLGVMFYAVQLWFSVWWLRRFRFGPFEWVWRSLTYSTRLYFYERTP